MSLPPTRTHNRSSTISHRPRPQELPRRPSTPYPTRRDLPVSSNDGSNVGQHNHQTGSDSNGSTAAHLRTLNRLSGVTTGESGETVEFEFPDPFQAQKALRQSRIMSGKSASMFSDRHRRPQSSAGRSRRSRGYDSDDDSDVDDFVKERRKRDNAEVIRSIRNTVERKHPTHRSVEARQLRPALRNTQASSGILRSDRMMDRSSLPPIATGYPGYSHVQNTYGQYDRVDAGRKPLPSLPASDFGSSQGQRWESSLRNMNRPISPLSPPISPMSSSMYGQSQLFQGYPHNSRDFQRPSHSGLFSLRSLRDALPFGSRNRGSAYGIQDPRAHATPHSPVSASSSATGSMPNIHELLPHDSHHRDTILEPADNLNLYLKRAIIEKWNKWIDLSPESAIVMEQGRWQTRPLWGNNVSAHNSAGSMHTSSSAKSGAISSIVSSAMDYRDVLNGSPERLLKQWLPRKNFFRAIDEFFEKNVPHRPIESSNRWGEQIFAVDAEGFDTVGFGDEAALRAEDAGLLGWVTGCILQTVVSVLHMLRYNSQNMMFQVIDSTVAPSRRDQNGRSHFVRGGARQENTTELPDGCGSLVLLDTTVPRDRAVIFCIRPPWLIGKRELADFCQGVRDWKRGPPDFLASPMGQANLLQATIFDDCIKNHCFFFCVTNMQHWAFGHFNPTFDRCSISPLINRKASSPSIMEIMTVWCLRAFDERPRDAEQVSPRPNALPNPTHSPSRSMQHPLPRDPPPSYDRPYPSPPDGLPSSRRQFHSTPVMVVEPHPGGHSSMLMSPEGSFVPRAGPSYPAYTMSSGMPDGFASGLYSGNGFNGTALSMPIPYNHSPGYHLHQMHVPQEWHQRRHQEGSEVEDNRRRSADTRQPHTRRNAYPDQTGR